MEVGQVRRIRSGGVEPCLHGYRDMLWNGVAERKKEKHSRYFLAIMAKHPRTAMDKDVTVLVPWLDSTLRSLQIDPLLPALHCQAQRLTPTTKEQCYMADMMAELCRESCNWADS